MNAGDLVLTGSFAAMYAIRVSVSVTEGRVRAAGWPLWRCGPAAWALVLHDVAVGWAALSVAAGVTRWAVARVDLGDASTALATALAAAIALIVTSAVLRRRRGAALRALIGPGRRVAEPCPTWRARLLGTVELAAVRGSARWIDGRLDRCLRRSGVTPEQLLPALWPAVRLRLREVPGVPRTEVALLLLQAQAVIEDASPARERMLTLLHLVYERAGRPGVRGAVEQARRAPVRHGRPGPVTAWGSTPAGVPTPIGAARTSIS